MSPRAVALKSGELIFSLDPLSIMTDLGSCVAFGVYDDRTGAAGMVHYLLPNRSYSGVGSGSDSNELNFGEVAIPALLRKFKQAGSRPSDLRVGIFGGSQGSRIPAAVEIGRANVECAWEWVRRFGLKVVSEKIRPPNGIRIRYFSELKKFEIEMPSQNIQASSSPVRVLIVDDSLPVRKVLRKILEAGANIEVVGEASLAREAEEMRRLLKPDVMTLDINMPEKDGITYLAELMTRSPMPVVLISDLVPAEAPAVLRGLEVGAFDYIQKPSLDRFQESSIHIQEVVLAAKGYQANKFSFYKQISTASGLTKSRHHQASPNGFACDLIAIGASTGGTTALRTLLSSVPAGSPPILIVQHMPAAFTKSFAASLDQVCGATVTEAQDGEPVEAGRVYLAPGGLHMLLRQTGSRLEIELQNSSPVNRFKPSVDVLFQSLASTKLVRRTHAAILTGMGNDGARGMLELKNRGAFTVAQDQASCVVWGMPRAAAEINAAVLIQDLNQICDSLLYGPRISKVAGV